ncbi:ribonuclease H-like protein [Auriscalpium vulgare]|uniref:Ribonuclease H-like protein n=1 Tax=Auriscalpium vulgare TaxID=40419 RepID=A0ACB8RB16_9AGAM|nr:ribonuclease H-like protein [Auriscalpium vulgare]
MADKPQTLDFYAGPIVWVDCEMTGLNPDTDKILEIAVLITDRELELVDDGIEFIIRTDKEALDRMDEWCTNQHGLSGLTQACLESPHSTESAQAAVLAYIKKWIPEKKIAVLGGNTVHADRAFLAKEMPDIVDWLHYRIIDVSSIKELHRRWYPRRPLPKAIFGGESKHRALDDIRRSIEELKWYRDNIFISPQAYNPQ